MPRILCLLVAVQLLSNAHAQDKKKEPLPGDVMIEKYLAAETDKLSKKFLDGAKTLKEWQDKRPRLYREYLDMLGLAPLPEKTTLNATVTGSFEHEGVVVENLHFQSIPGLYVTANFYRPKSPAAKKLPTILYVCGHSNKGRDGSKSAYQDHPMWFASNGYNCLILDTLQLGEIPGVHHGTYGRPWLHLSAYGNTDKEKQKTGNRFWWHSLGYTPAGVEAWNGIRAIDYLLTRPEVDGDRIGVTGISGGGAATFWIACADDRVKVAVPVSGMSDLESYVKNKVINGHCDCMFLYNTYLWDWTIIAALVAPRPMLFANSDNDPIFPMDGNRRIATKLRKLYAMYGQPDRFEEYVSKGGHAYRPDLRIAIFRFLNKHLKGDEKSEVKDADFAKIDGKKLRVFPTDADLPKDSINHRVDEVFVKRGKMELPGEGKYEEWRKEVLSELRHRVFHAIPSRVTAGKPWKKPVNVEGIGETWIPAVATEPGIDIAGCPILAERKVQSLQVVVERTIDRKREDLVKKLIFPGTEWVIYPRSLPYTTPLSWTLKSPPNYIVRAHALLGRTPDVGNVWDVIATFKHLHHQEKAAPILWGCESGGILAAYAALLEPSIEEIVLIDPMTSHMQGPHFLNILRVLDIPDALGLLAPRKLTIIGGRDPAFDRTAEIYRRAGAADKLVRK